MAVSRVVGLAGVLCLLASCSKTDARPDAGTPPVASKAAVPSASASAWPTLSPAKEDEVDLLYVTRSVMAVSSKVDNPKDFPEHLVDRDPKTAWNSKTGDLVGAWIAFRVPFDVQVKRLEIVVGFDKIAKDGTDLFTANHRIKKVEVTRDGSRLGMFDLDPEKRSVQSIPIDAKGGEYKVTVLETVPGTKKEWRELTVSEFHVIGTTPHHDRLGGERPKVLIGSLDPPAARSYAAYSAAMKAFYPTPQAFCEAQMKTVDLEKGDTERMMGCGGRDTPSCKTSPAPKIAEKLKPPFLDVAAVSYVRSSSSAATTYLLKTAKGWHLAEELGGSDSDDCNPGCPSLFSETNTESIEVAPSTVPAFLIRERFATYLGDGNLVTRTVQICRLQPDETLACDKRLGLNERVERNGDASPPDYPKATDPWKTPDLAFTITPDGKIERKGTFTSRRDESWPQF